MKEGWTYKKLGEVATFISGYTPSKKDISNQGEYPYFKVAEMNVSGNELFMKNTSLFVNSPKRIYPKGSIIFPKNGGAIYTEKKRILEVDSVIDLNTEAVFPSEQVKMMYLFYLLTFIKISSFDKGGGLPSLDLKKMSALIIPVPPLPEQQSIVEYLDSAFAKIDTMKANAEKALNEAKSLFQASLKEMLEPKEGWEEKKLGDVCVKSKNIRWDEYLDDKIFKYIDLTSVDRETLTIIEPQIIDKKNAPSRAKQIVKTGDIIFANTRPTLRRVCMISESFDNQICSTGFCVLRPKEHIISKWIFYSLLNEDFYKYIEPLQTGASYPAVTDGIVKKYPFYYPSSITEQQSIVATLDSLKSKVDKLQANFDKISQECDALKQSILRQVFE